MESDPVATARGSDTKSLHECCRQVHRQSFDRQSSSQEGSRRVVTKSREKRRFDCSSKYSSLKLIASCDIELDDSFFRKSIEVIHYSELSEPRAVATGSQKPDRGNMIPSPPLAVLAPAITINYSANKFF